MSEFLRFDLAPLMLAVLSALSCSVIGTFLLLRREALMGDAISHAVLPGIVIGFLLTGTRDTLPMMGGALGAAIAAILLVPLVRKVAQVEPGAAMGVVFTSFFALGIVLIEQGGAAQVHLDAEHALFGNLQNAIWLEAESLADLARAESWAALDPAVPRLAAITALILALSVIFYKEIRLVCFDPLFANLAGFSPRLVGGALLLLTALCIVAAFEAVGILIVIALLVCPPAAARMLTDRFGHQIALSAAIGIFCAVSGYYAAAFGPSLFGFSHAVSAPGMIGVMAGIVQGLMMLFAPRYGVFRRQIVS